MISALLKSVDCIMDEALPALVRAGQMRPSTPRHLPVHASVKDSSQSLRGIDTQLAMGCIQHKATSSRATLS